jgi:hypothetical protein
MCEPYSLELEDNATTRGETDVSLINKTDLQIQGKEIECVEYNHSKYMCTRAIDGRS